MEIESTDKQLEHMSNEHNDKREISFGAGGPRYVLNSDCGHEEVKGQISKKLVR